VITVDFSTGPSLIPQFTTVWRMLKEVQCFIEYVSPHNTKSVRVSAHVTHASSLFPMLLFHFEKFLLFCQVTQLTFVNERCHMWNITVARTQYVAKL
jgi:hypothetical protein